MLRHEIKSKEQAMREQDRADFYATMTGVLELYSKRASVELLEIYFNALETHELEDIRRAINLHAVDPDQGQYCPKPADIVRLLSGSKVTRAMQAWSKVARACGSIGRYQSVAFDDPIIHAVIEDMGGWIALCELDDRSFDIRSNEFVKRYQGYALQGGVSDFPSHLAGLVELDCERHEAKLPLPRLIGNPEVAKQLFAIGRKEPKSLTARSGADVAAGVVAHLADYRNMNKASNG